MNLGSYRVFLSRMCINVSCSSVVSPDDRSISRQSHKIFIESLRKVKLAQQPGYLLSAWTAQSSLCPKHTLDVEHIITTVYLSDENSDIDVK